MTKFAVESNTLVVSFQFGEKSVARHRRLRIPLSLVESVSIETSPWEWLTQRVKFTRRLSIINDATGVSDFVGSAPLRPEANRWAHLNGEWVLLVGPLGAQVYARISPQLPALRVDLTEAVPYVGFLVARRDAGQAATDLRTAISR
jgi:hypothetical protein